MTKYDTSSPEPVLFITGPGIADVPDTDLSANQLARIAWTRLPSDERPSLPADLDEKAIGALADEFVKSGAYSTTPSADAKPAAPKKRRRSKPAPKPTPAPEPVAEEPAAPAEPEA